MAILHREPGQDSPVGALPTWRTCLREVVFLDDAPAPPTADTHDQLLTEGQAYRLLLEILCGLQSPMTGETQVLGQFKAFLASLPKGASDIPQLPATTVVTP